MADQEALYFIGAAAKQAGLHPASLRKYERLGLMAPSRTIGRVRLYSESDLARLRQIKYLLSL